MVWPWIWRLLKSTPLAFTFSLLWPSWFVAVTVYSCDAHRQYSRVWLSMVEETPTQSVHCSQPSSRGSHSVPEQLARQLTPHWYVAATLHTHNIFVDNYRCKLTKCYIINKAQIYNYIQGDQTDHSFRKIIFHDFPGPTEMNFHDLSALHFSQNTVNETWHMNAYQN